MSEEKRVSYSVSRLAIYCFWGYPQNLLTYLIRSRSIGVKYVMMISHPARRKPLTVSSKASSSLNAPA
jgi:hypothetical protein